MATRLWTFLTTDVTELVSTQTIDKTATAAQAVFGLAAALAPGQGKVQPQQLVPLVNQIDSLLDVLNSPLGEVVEKSLPFVSIATGLLRFYLEKSQVPPSLEKCIALGCQAAYLESFAKLLAQESPAFRQRLGQAPSKAVERALDKLSALEITEELAQQAVTRFPQTKLAEAFGEVLKARLSEAGLEESEVHWWVQRVAWNTPKYMLQVWAKSKEATQHLGQPTLSDWSREQNFNQGVQDYLARVIEPGPKEKVFGEADLTFEELYVPLDLQPLNSDGQIDIGQSCSIRAWVEKFLLKNEGAKNQILFLQGEAGRGKSVFCRMFADWMQRELFPAYTPILIRLRDLRKHETSLADTLAQDVRVQQYIVKDDNWFKRQDIRFLFLLDGFDELLLAGSSKGEGGLKEFLEQVEQLQGVTHHRFLITGRPLAFQGMDRLISQTNKLLRAKIEPMNDSLRKRWFRQWGAKFGPEEADSFQHFLTVCPNEINNELAREPLLLYLLGMMHRDPQANLNARLFEEEDGIQAKVSIYDEAVRWVLEKQRGDETNTRLTQLTPKDLREALNEAALCVIQSGNEVARLSFLEDRLKKEGNNPVLAALQQARQENGLSEKKQLNNILTAFYIKPSAEDKDGAVEFVHKSFGEFLFAERLANTLEDWSNKAKSRRGGWEISDSTMHHEIYDLLGYGLLSQEVLTYIIALLQRADRFEVQQWKNLFRRLQDFYLRWCEGEFIDAVKTPESNLPRSKMLTLRQQTPERELSLGLREIDISSGLNSMILLFEFHRFGQFRKDLESITFSPLNNQELEKIDKDRFLRILNYSKSLRNSNFDPFRRFWRGANLQEANLQGADIERANLQGANLSGTNLQGANLQEANLAGANLQGPNLQRADLQGADLQGADLEGAYLQGADLEGAYLQGANLQGAYLQGTNLQGVNLQEANLQGADLQGADLEDADLQGAYLERADLLGAYLQGAYLQGANVLSTRFSQTASLTEEEKDDLRNRGALFLDASEQD